MRTSAQVASLLATRVARSLPLVLAAFAACSAPAQQSPTETPATTTTDAVVVAAQPGAWFDASGNLTVVGAGRRLRLVLSAPIFACASAFEQAGSTEQVATRASLPFHVVGEACRDAHPSILLAEEGDTASPAELERSYHEIARCGGSELGLDEGWRPSALEATDPCPLALGLGWRLPSSQELSGLSLDDRKAIAGALFDTDARGGVGGLLVYAKGAGGEITLATLSPNAAEQPPVLPEERKETPFFGASVRCTKDGVGKPPPLPVLPFAAACLKEQRQKKTQSNNSAAQPPAEVLNLKSWLDLAERTPRLLHDVSQLKELTAMLQSPTLEALAKEAREERALTERYAELAEAVDDPNVSADERQRRRDEFQHLRRRLGGKILESATKTSAGRTQLGALLLRLDQLLAAAENAGPPKKGQPKLDYRALRSRVQELGGMTKR